MARRQAACWVCSVITHEIVVALIVLYTSLPLDALFDAVSGAAGANIAVWANARVVPTKGCAELTVFGLPTVEPDTTIGLFFARAPNSRYRARRG